MVTDENEIWTVSKACDPTADKPTTEADNRRADGDGEYYYCDKDFILCTYLNTKFRNYIDIY